ncbi:hypothetical protein KXV85_005531, partial [Aspergillus fumigatus]
QLRESGVSFRRNSVRRSISFMARSLPEHVPRSERPIGGRHLRALNQALEKQAAVNLSVKSGAGRGPRIRVNQAGPERLGSGQFRQPPRDVLAMTLGTNCAVAVNPEPVRVPLHSLMESQNDTAADSRSSE